MSERAAPALTIEDKERSRKVNVERLLAWKDMLFSNLYTGAAAIVVASLAAMYVVDYLFSHVCRALARRTATTLDDSFIDMIHRPIRASVLLFGLWLTAQHLGVSGNPLFIIAASFKTLAAVLWLIFAMRFTGLLLTYMNSIERISLVEPRTQPLFDNLAKIVLLAGAVYVIMLFWHVNLTAWLASAGIIGIAIGFAAKDTLANLFSGIFILADAPYKVGDFINLDSGERGEVTHIGLRSTRLLTRDDVEITIPNAVTAGAKIVNETGGPWQKERIRIQVGVAYGSDIDLLRRILLEIASHHDEICKDPVSRVRFRSFGDSSLQFELLCWIAEPVLRGRVIDALNCEIYKRLAQERIEIPYPKRDVYIKQMPGTRTE